MSTGRVFDIARACVHDGPGLRTVVYLKGCHLDCPWCHNVEGKSFEQTLSFDEKKCLAMTAGRKACDVDCPVKDKESYFIKRSSPPLPLGEASPGRRMDGAIVACPSGALRLVGTDYTPELLVDTVLKDVAFFKQTGGGVTFSGGEPLAQHGFLLTCSDALRAKGVHTAIETAGLWQGNLVRDVTGRLDMVLFDLKHVDGAKHKRFTGADNGPILNNLRALSDAGIPMELRVTLIPGFNDTDDEVRDIARLLNTLGRTPPVRLLAFHRLATAKQALFGYAYPYADHPLLPANRLTEIAALLSKEYRGEVKD